MNILKKGILFIAICIFFQFTSWSQNPNTTTGQSGLKKNVVFGSIHIIGLGGGFDGSYERMISESQEKFITSLYARASYGVWAVGFGGEGTHFGLGLAGLTGKSKSHLEFNAGIASFYDRLGYDIGISNADYFNEPRPMKSEYRQILPTVAVGYRFQKPGGHFIFRTGVGFPEGAYASIGFCF